MIEAYLVELRRCLGRRLPPAVLATRVREAEGHLRMAAREFGGVEALRRYGSARHVADAMVRAHRGYDARSVSSLSWAVGIVVALCLVLTSLYLQLSTGNVWSSALLPMLFEGTASLALLAFAIRVVQTRRWLVLPVGAWAATGMAIVILVSVFHHPLVESRDMPALRANIQRELREWETRKEVVVRWKRGDVPLTAPVVQATLSTDYRPLVPFAIVRSGERYLKDEVLSKEAAARAWSSLGPEWAEFVQRRVEINRANLAALPHLFPSNPVYWAWITLMWLESVLWSSTMLLVTNALTLALLRLREEASLDRRRSPSDVARNR